MQEKQKYLDIKAFVLYFIAFFFIIKPDYFSYMGNFTKLYNIGFFITICFIILKKIRKRKISKKGFLIILIAVIPLIIGLMQGAKVSMSVITPIIQVICLTFILEDGLEDNFDKCLDALACLLELYTYINFITVILYPNGLYEMDLYSGSYWFLGYKNVMIRFLIPAIFCNIVKTIRKKKKYSTRLFALIVTSIATQLIVDCKTGLIGIGIIVIMMLLFSRESLPRWINGKNCFIFIGIFSIILATTHLMDSFSDILASLGETMSVSHRQAVWKRAIELIAKNPIIGYGARTSSEYKELINLSTGWGYFSHPHNYFLYMALQGGILIYILIIALMINISKKSRQNKKNIGSKFLIVMYVAFFVMGISESLSGAILLYPLAIFSDYFSVNEVIYDKKKERKK